MIPFVLLGITTLVLTYAGVAFLIRWTLRKQVLDIPNDRSCHTTPTPRGGGLAIAAVSLLGFAGSAAFIDEPWAGLVCYGVGAAMLAVVGWVDDLKSLSNRFRFGIQMLAAALVLLGFGYWRAIPLPFLGELPLSYVGLAVTFVWIVGLSNAYNFMDGIDGIAGGQGVVAGLGWVMLGVSADRPLLILLGGLLAAACLGFLGHNWPPAKIFMGDVGSVMLGFTFAALPVMAAQQDPAMAVCGVLLVWPFVFDTVFTFIRRLRKGENVFQAHRQHMFQRLVIAGRTHQQVTTLFIFLAALGAVCASLYRGGEPVAQSLALLCPLVMGFSLWRYTLATERSAAGEAEAATPAAQAQA